MKLEQFARECRDILRRDPGPREVAFDRRAGIGALGQDVRHAPAEDDLGRGQPVREEERLRQPFGRLGQRQLAPGPAHAPELEAAYLGG